MPIRARTPSRSPGRPTWARTAVWFYFGALVLLLCLSAFLWKSGDMLVRSNAFDHVRWAVVLAGEERDMERTEGAWTLFQEGRFDSLILSGPRAYKTHYESEFSSELLLSRGFPRDRLFQLPNEASSTQEEANLIIAQARTLGIDTLLVITSNYHSARAGRIFRRRAGGYPVIQMVAAETPFFDPKSWWSYRTAREIWLLEWLKTVNSRLESLRQKPLVGSAEWVLLEPNPRPQLPAPDSSTAVSRPDTAFAPSPKPVKDSAGAAKDTPASDSSSNKGWIAPAPAIDSVPRPFKPDSSARDSSAQDSTVKEAPKPKAREKAAGDSTAKNSGAKQPDSSGQKPKIKAKAKENAAPAKSKPKAGADSVQRKEKPKKGK